MSWPTVYLCRIFVIHFSFSASLLLSLIIKRHFLEYLLLFWDDIVNEESETFSKSACSASVCCLAFTYFYVNLSLALLISVTYKKKEKKACTFPTVISVQERKFDDNNFLKKSFSMIWIVWEVENEVNSCFNIPSALAKSVRESWTLCLHFYSCKWLTPTRKEFYILNLLLGLGLINLRMFF